MRNQSIKVATATNYFSGWSVANEIRDRYEKERKKGEYLYLFKRILYTKD